MIALEFLVGYLFLKENQLRQRIGQLLLKKWASQWPSIYSVALGIPLLQLLISPEL